MIPRQYIKRKDFSFQPSTLTVPIGTTVTWHNQDGTPHTVTSDQQGLFDSGTLANGKKFSFTFTNPGRYEYHCNNHPNMRGEVEVSSSISEGTLRTVATNIVAPGQVSQGIDQGQNQEYTQSAIQGTSQPSPGGKKPSWSEKPTTSQAKTYTATSQAPQGIALQTNLGESTSQSQISKFSQYYEMTEQAPSKPLSAPIKYELTGQEPATLYFGSSQKSVPYTQYQSYLSSAGLNSLWIQGTYSWTQYAVVPQGSSLSLISTSPLAVMATFTRYTLTEHWIRIAITSILTIRLAFTPIQRVNISCSMSSMVSPVM